MRHFSFNWLLDWHSLPFANSIHEWRGLATVEGSGQWTVELTSLSFQVISMWIVEEHCLSRISIRWHRTKMERLDFCFRKNQRHSNTPWWCGISSGNHKSNSSDNEDLGVHDGIAGVVVVEDATGKDGGPRHGLPSFIPTSNRLKNLDKRDVMVCKGFAIKRMFIVLSMPKRNH